MRIRTLAAAALLAVSVAAQAQSVQLISAEEAKLPPAAPKTATRAITRGPGVKLVSPDSVSGAFALKVAFEPRGGSKIDADSVKVEYLRGNVVDLTERVKAGISADGITLAAASAPAGQHAIRVSVRDSEGRQGSAEFSLTVR